MAIIAAGNNECNSISLPFGQAQTYNFFGAQRPVLHDVFAQKLGKTPTKIWAVLVGLRDEKGVAHPTRNFLAKTLGMSVASIAKGLRRLKETGMVKPLGKIIRHDVMYGPTATTSKVFCWQIFGFWTKKFIRIPVTVWHSIASTHKSWGGQRSNSGRPKKGSVTTEKHSEKNQDYPPNSNKYIHARFPYGETPAKRARTRDTNFFQQRGDGMPVIGGGQFKVDGFWPWLVQQKLVPPPPMFGKMKPTVVPAPRLLRDDDSITNNVKHLGAMYRGLLKSLGVESKYLFTNRAIGFHKDYKRLKQCVELFKEHRIAPGGWVLWSFEQWQDYDKRRGDYPHPRYIFDPKRIETLRGMFRSQYTPPRRVVIGKATRRILEKYGRMKREILALPTNNPREMRLCVPNIVDAYFPNGLYDLLVDTAQQQAQMEQTKFQTIVNGNGWVW